MINVLLGCGGRDYHEPHIVLCKLDYLNSKWQIDMVVEGGARGADSCIRSWAHSRGVPVMTFHADWDTHGKSAGYIRNSEMLKYVMTYALGDMSNLRGISFKGGKGTAMMVRLMKNAGMQVDEILIGGD